MTIASPTDGDVFLAYLEQVSCPQLQPGQVVIMDNLSAHKVQGVREQIEARGARRSIRPPTRRTSTPLSRPGRRSSRGWPALGEGPNRRSSGTRDRRSLGSRYRRDASAWSSTRISVTVFVTALLAAA